jgi:hypothetical protein
MRAGVAVWVGRRLGAVVAATVAGAWAGGALLTVVARGQGAPGDAWAAAASWSVAAVYALVGAVAGGVAGFTLAAARALRDAEAELASALQTAAAARGTDGGARTALTDARERYERFADEAVARSVGALRLPGSPLLARLVRARLRHRLVDDFLAACEREGVRSVGPGEVARWLASQGPAYLLAPVHLQLRVWRLVAIGAAGAAMAGRLVAGA